MSVGPIRTGMVLNTLRPASLCVRGSNIYCLGNKNTVKMMGVRFQSNLPDPHKPKDSNGSEPPAKHPESSNQSMVNPNDWKLIKTFIPGEKPVTDKLQDRVPQFPLGKENVPTLLPRPGVPQVGKNFNFRQVVNILKHKTAPELIYESEPHRLYFLMSFCFGATLLIYSAVLLEWAHFEANQEYYKNEEEQNDVYRKREWILNWGKNSIFGAIALVSAIFVITFPTRLVRRMHYLPGPVEHIKFTTYPLLPGQSTPVVTLPLKSLERKHKARVWTGKGFYGTSDNSLFFFVLKEIDNNGKTIKNWVIDRKGFFWSDGRIFDYLFGKETIAEAEAGIPYDEQIGIVHKQVQQKKKQLREKHGMFYQWKFQKQEMKKDLQKLGGKTKGPKRIGPK